MHAIQIAIDKALEQHGALREVIVPENLDPTAIALVCADRAALCRTDQTALAAVFLLAAASIHHLQQHQAAIA